MRKSDKFRMIEWLLIAAALYAGCIALRTLGIEPQVQVVLWKLANLTVAAHVGYWMDRRAFTRILVTSSPHEQIRRAIVMSAAMLTVGMGL
ncbi:putative holin [Burkholderia sp. BE12]|uniref:putative holin n=1 Tax=Burkholderia sp. BE12 TaxID=2082394 RepID=UPI000CF528BE|nr:putative holin [Burkholderia sp. BE12]